MDYLLVVVAALFASGLTLFSGFGLGTLLLPVFALFFPLGVAVAATAIVHLANNLFKAAAIGRHARIDVALRFGIPALLATAIGAGLLGLLSGLDAVTTYDLLGRTCTVTPIKLVVGLLMVAFAALEFSPGLRTFDPKWLPLGGAASGFFGGLTGHQGALRSAFLSRTLTDTKTYVATGVIIACAVDVVRTSVYLVGFLGALFASGALPLVGAGTLAAFLGAFIGIRLMHKVKIDFVRKLVGVLLVLVGAALAAGAIA